jgi:hypothetical protein
LILTFYNKDGTKVRRPIGYAGGKCNVATAAYERREIPGSVKKTPTAEADYEEPVEVEVSEEVKVR